MPCRIAPRRWPSILIRHALHRHLLAMLALIGLLPWTSASATLQPPVLQETPEETLLAIGDGLESSLALDSRGQPHVMYGGAFSNNQPLRHAWYDGLVWRVRSIAPERTLALDTVRVGEFLHIAAKLLDPASGAEQLHYLRINLGTQEVFRRLVSEQPVGEFHIAVDRTGARIGVVYRVATSVFLLEGLPDIPNQFTLPRPPGSSALLDFIHVPGEGVALAYSRVVENPTPGDVFEVRVLRSGPGGETDEIAFDSNVVVTPIVARLATNDAGELVVVIARDRWMRASLRRGPDSWGCNAEASPFPPLVPCIAATLRPASAEIAVARDAGSGQIHGLLRDWPDLTQEPRVRGFSFARGASEFEAYDALPPGTLDGDGRQLELARTASGGFGLLYRGDRLYALRTTAPWRSRPIDGLPNASGAVALAVDPRGEPVVVADYGPTSGLRASVWREDLGQLTTAGLRPLGERYAESAAAFADSGSLYVAARAVPQNDLVLIQRDPGSVATTRTLLSSANDTGYSPQVAAVGDRVAVVWLDRDFGQVRYAERIGDSGTFAFETALPVNVGPDAQPRLALSRSGIAYVSVFDAASGTLRVFARSDGEFTLHDTVLEPGAQPMHAVAATPNGLPALLYGLRQADDSIVLRYRYDRLGQRIDQPASLSLPAGAELSALRLALQHDSPTDARVLVGWRFTGDPTHTVLFGERISAAAQGVFRYADSLGSVPDAELLAGLGLAISGRSFIAAGDGRALLEVRRIEGGVVPPPEEVLEPVTTPEPTYQYFNSHRGPLSQCFCLLIPCPLPPAARGGPAPTDLSSALRARFATTAAGRYYLDLYSQHGSEMAGLLLADPALLGQRIQAFQQFMPVLDAFVDGRGAQVVMTRPMLERARAVWQAWADQGSPALRAAIEGELARTDDLRDFIGMSAEQWFTSLPGAPPLFADGFE